MLTMIWVLLLVLVAIAASYFATRAEQKGCSEDADVHSSAAAAVSLGANVLAWPHTGAPLGRWVDAALPQPGTVIHTITGEILVLVAGIALWFSPLVIGYVLAVLRQRSKSGDAAARAN